LAAVKHRKERGIVRWVNEDKPELRTVDMMNAQKNKETDAAFIRQFALHKSVFPTL
jgi:hypothetical protein